MLETSFTKLVGCRVPIQQAGMSKIASPALAAAVSEAGGALACWNTGSKAEALAAVKAGCDLVGVQGVEAGGHVRELAQEAEQLLRKW